MLLPVSYVPSERVKFHISKYGRRVSEEIRTGGIRVEEKKEKTFDRKIKGQKNVKDRAERLYEGTCPDRRRLLTGELPN
jgi:hypothetical protein